MKKRIEIEIEKDLKFCRINNVVFAPDVWSQHGDDEAGL